MFAQMRKITGKFTPRMFTKMRQSRDNWWQWWGYE